MLQLKILASVASTIFQDNEIQNGGIQGNTLYKAS